MYKSKMDDERKAKLVAITVVPEDEAVILDLDRITIFVWGSVFMFVIGWCIRLLN